MAAEAISLSHPCEPWQLQIAKNADTYKATLWGEGFNDGQPCEAPVDAKTYELYRTHAEPREYIQGSEYYDLIDRVAPLLGGSAVVCTITGRSGSGKSWLAQKVAKTLQARGVSVATLSSDDYNIGVRRIYELTGQPVGSRINWDKPYVYDTSLLADHLAELKNGRAIPRHVYDFGTGEPYIEPEPLKPAQVVIVEGLMTNASEIREIADASHVMETPLATCIGRRILRDFTSGRNVSIGNSYGALLGYMLRVTEPEYMARLSQTP
jgi:uridine kinase